MQMRAVSKAQLYNYVSSTKLHAVLTRALLVSTVQAHPSIHVDQAGNQRH